MGGIVVCSSIGDAVFPPDPSCGTITLTSPVLPSPPPDWPPNLDFIATGPFTATVVGDGFDLAGQGVVVAGFCRSSTEFPCNTGVTFPPIVYTFSVSEPPTLLLVVASFGALGVLFSARFLRRPPGSRLPEHP